MAIDSKHPDYTKFLEDWEQMEDTYRGERIVKESGTKYLPATSGMEQDGMGGENAGQKAYNSYRKRAVFHEFVSDAVEAALGMMHHKPPTIELPAAMEDMRDNATINGEGLEHLLRRINERQLVEGRLGLLADLPATPQLEVRPYIALYTAKTVINWDAGSRDEITRKNLNLVVLDETEAERGGDFEWQTVNKFRILQLGDLIQNEQKGEATYKVGVFRRGDSHTDAAMSEPVIRGQKSKQIPFVFINSKDTIPTPDDPPLIGLSNLTLAIYRGEADYRQSLFMQGQDTLVLIGGATEDDGKPMRVGANATIHIPQVDGDAKFIGVDSAGLAEQREALQNDKQLAASKAGQFISSRSKGGVESGDALEIRLTAETATLNQIALAGANALQQLLRILAEWMGQDPMKVIVKPNLDFARKDIVAKELVEYMTAKTMGAPLSLETIHFQMQKRGLTELSFEDELAKIEDEEPLVDGIDDLDEEEEEEEQE